VYSQPYFFNKKNHPMKIKSVILLFLFILFGCEKYAVETKDITLSGKYVVSRIDITNVDQATERDSLYNVGTTYKGLLPNPFDSIRINRFYIHLDYSTIRMNLLGVSHDGRDIWEYGNYPNEIFYQVLSNNTYNNGFLRFTYLSKSDGMITFVFLIEEDGFETLQLRSSGSWMRGKEGQKQVMTLYLTRVGP
jgi:hypothetical protein